jgi:O-antigen/teichoic acid export membrane protein
MVFMPQVVNLISPQKGYTIPAMFVLLLGVYYVVRVWTDSLATVLMSMSYLRPFWLLVPVQALLSAVLQWVLIPKLGIYGVVFGIIGSFLLTVSWGLPLAYFRRAEQHLDAVPLAENR